MTEEGPTAHDRGGLSGEEARRRLAQEGERAPLPSSRSYKSIVRSNTLTLFNLVLGAFFVLVVVAGRPRDGLFLGVLVANTAIGIYQESRAKQALDRAALLVAPRARVVRDGKPQQVAVDEVVIGDLVELGPGDQVVADGTVVESVGLMLDESPLTGESVPVGRGEGERILSGSFAVEGAGAYLVEQTGADSYAAQLLGQAREQRKQRSPLEIQIGRLLRILIVIMIPLGIAFVWSLQRQDVPFREAAATATAGIVTLVPEGLILLTSLTFAVTAATLVGKGMLVQYLNAVESLANVDTVCLDKTGTLTDGELELEQVAPLAAGAEAEPLLAAFAASAAIRNDTLDAIARGLPGQAADPDAEVPFSSRWKWSALRAPGAERWMVLGAPDVLLGEVPAVVEQRQAEGMRALVFGWADQVPTALDGAVPDGVPAIEPLAAVVLRERLREDAGETIAFLHDQGVDVKVMSGDGSVTVAAIAQAVGIDPGPGAVTGDQLPDDDKALGELAASRRVFARLKPEQKRRLVEALRARGGYVAMIGDGVNDVPAMKASRIAIALGSGSQLAKSVADSVLVADRFGAIPDAVGEGRRIIRNVQRVANLFVTKSVFAAAVIVTFGLTTAEFPLLPRHLSLAATFTVGIPGFVLALAPGRAAKPSGSFLRRVARFSIPAGVVEAAAVILAYLAVAELRGYSQQEGRTAATTVFVAVGLYLLLVLEADRMSGSRRYSVGVLTLVTLLAVGYLLVLGSPALRDFFALSTPGVWMAIVCVTVLVISIQLLSWCGLSPYRPLPADT